MNNTLEFGAASAKGPLHYKNEDAWSILSVDDKTFFVVVDGIGGGPFSGDKGRDFAMKEALSCIVSSKDATKALEQAALNGKSSQVDVGAVAVICCFSNQRLELAWCGDASAMGVLDGSCSTITSPHREFGIPYSYIGGTALSSQVSTVSIALRSKEKILLVSDGVSDVLSRGQIVNLCTNNTCSEASNLIVKNALKNGDDDATAIVFEMVDNSHL